MFNQIIRYKTVIDFIKKHGSLKNILEVGSGSKGIGKFMPSLQYTGLDKTTSDYSTTEHKTSKNMKFVTGDSLDMPFDSDSYDLVFSLDMIEHIPSELRMKAIDECVRVSSKYIIIAFPYGIFGSLSDEIFYQYKRKKNLKIDGWLEEHISYHLPQQNFIDEVKEKYKHLHIKEFDNGNIFFVIAILYCENIRYISTILVYISYLFAYLPFSFNSKTGVRKFFIIEK